MIEKRVAVQGSDPNSGGVTMNMQFSNRGINENKRATSLFNSRENSAGGLESLLEARDPSMNVIIEGDNEKDSTNQTP